MSDDDFLITVNDLIDCGFCATGQLRWFRSHQLDFREHLARGTPASTLLSTGDGLAEHAVAVLKERRRG